MTELMGHQPAQLWIQQDRKAAVPASVSQLDGNVGCIGGPLAGAALR
jgi:hypothetical protein